MSKSFFLYLFVGFTKWLPTFWCDVFTPELTDSSMQRCLCITTLWNCLSIDHCLGWEFWRIQHTLAAALNVDTSVLFASVFILDHLLPPSAPHAYLNLLATSTGFFRKTVCMSLWCATGWHSLFFLVTNKNGIGFAIHGCITTQISCPLYWWC